MSMETLTTDRIQKAFQDLENQKSAIANCSLLWKSFSDYCSSIEKALEGRSQAIDSKLEAMEFETKQAMESINERELTFPEREAAAVKLIADRRDSAIAEIESSSSQIPRNIDGILRWYCRRMDSSGLWRFMMSRRRELEISRTEISEAMAETLDPPRLVIDAVQDFINSADAASIASCGEKFWGLNELLKALLDLTEKSSMEMSGSIRDRAEEVAVNWKEKYEGKKGGNGNEGGMEGAEARIFLKMVVAFGIRSKFKDAFLLKLVVENSSRKDVGKLAGRLQFGKKIEELIELVRNGKEIDAIYLAHESGLMDQFSPLPLLRSFLQTSWRNANAIMKKNQSKEIAPESNNFEINALKSIIKCVETFNLERQFAVDNLRKRVGELENISLKNQAQKPQQQLSIKSQAKRSMPGYRPSKYRSSKPSRSLKPYSPYHRRPNPAPPIPPSQSYGYGPPAPSYPAPAHYYVPPELPAYRGGPPFGTPAINSASYDYNAPPAHPQYRW